MRRDCLNPDGTLTSLPGNPDSRPAGPGPDFSALPLGRLLRLPAPARMPYQSALPVRRESHRLCLLGNPAGFEFAGAPFTPLSAGLLDYNNNVANASYNGLTVSALERLGKYFNLTANYTYSHTIDNRQLHDFHQSAGEPVRLPGRARQFQSGCASSLRGKLHRHGPDHGFARNFEFSSIITLQSGRPFTLFVGQQQFWVIWQAQHRPCRRPAGGRQLPSVIELRHQVSRNTYVGDTAVCLGCAPLPKLQDRTEHMELNFSVDRL